MKRKDKVDFLKDVIAGKRDLKDLYKYQEEIYKHIENGLYKNIKTGEQKTFPAGVNGNFAAYYFFDPDLRDNDNKPIGIGVSSLEVIEAIKNL
jgi:hypothetical protein